MSGRDIIMEARQYTCKKVNQIWDEVNNLLFQKYNDTINISVTDVLFGFNIKMSLDVLK